MTTRVGLYRDKRNKGRPWTVRWFGEFDPSKGKQRHYSQAFARKRDAEEFQAAKQAELNRGGERDVPDDISLADFIELFKKTRGKNHRLGTRKVYQNTFDQLIASWGPGVVLRRISRELAERFISSRDRVSKHGEGYSAASRNQHTRNCKAVFQAAVEWGYVTKNPFSHIKQKRTSGRRWHYLKPPEFVKILRAVSNLRWQALYLLAYTTGARLGELFNLTWADVDFEKGIVSIRDRTGTPETPSFKVKDYEARTLSLPEQAIEALLAWQEEAPDKVPYILLTAERWRIVRSKWQMCQQGEPYKLNVTTGDLEWGEWENRLMVNNVLKDMNRHALKAGLELTAPLSIHTLRKSFAQNHANSGTPSATLKWLMGHASIATTEQFYLQQSNESEEAAAKRYQGLISNATCVGIAYEGSAVNPGQEACSATSFYEKT